MKHPAPAVVKKARGFNVHVHSCVRGLLLNDLENVMEVWWRRGGEEECHFCLRRLVSLTRSLPRARRLILHVKVLMGNLVTVEASFVHISWILKVSGSLFSSSHFM